MLFSRGLNQSFWELKEDLNNFVTYIEKLKTNNNYSNNPPNKGSYEDKLKPDQYKLNPSSKYFAMQKMQQMKEAYN